MGQDCNSRSHVCCRIFAHFGVAKDYGNAETKPQQEAAVVSHEVSADLPNAQTATTASDLPQANMPAQQATDATAPVSQQLISVQTDLYHLWINLKVVILFVLNYSIMTRIKTAMNHSLCWKAMRNGLMSLSRA